MNEYFLNKFAESELSADAQEKVAEFLSDVSDEGIDPEAFLFELGMEKAAEYVDELYKEAKKKAKRSKPNAFSTEMRNYKNVAKAYGGGVGGWAKGIGAMGAEAGRGIGRGVSSAAKWVGRHPIGSTVGLGATVGAGYGAKKLYDYLMDSRKPTKQASAIDYYLYKEAKKKAAKKSSKPNAFSTEMRNYKNVAKAYGGGVKGWTKGIGALGAEAGRGIGSGVSSAAKWVGRHPIGSTVGLGATVGAGYGAKKLYDYLTEGKKKTKQASYADDLVELAKQKLYGDQ